MKSKFIAAALALSSFAMFGSPAVAQDPQDQEECPLSIPEVFDNVWQGLDAYKVQDYVEAEKWLSRAAEQGNNEYAQFYLGLMYGNGLGVPQNDAEAVKWLRLAAEGGLPDAQCTLGVAYARGMWVPQNAAEAEKWLSRAAAAGWSEFVTRRFPNMTPKQ